MDRRLPQIPKEHVQISVQFNKLSMVCDHTQYTLVDLGEGLFGLISSEQDILNALDSGPFALNVTLDPHHTPEKTTQFDTSTFTKKFNIPVLSSTIIAMESECVDSIEMGQNSMLICEVCHVERIQQQTLQQKLKQLGVLPTLASSGE